MEAKPQSGCWAADERLLRDVSAGDASAVKRLLDEVAPVVYGYLFARVGGNEPAAEDLLQETLFEGVRSAAGYRGEAALTTWLCSIARRRLARFYEQERKAEAARRGLFLVGETTGDSGVDNLDLQDEVARALGRLSALHRQVLVMKYLDGQTVDQVADQLGRSPVQIQSLLQRARDGLRRELEDHG